jgi:spermidine synthase
MIAPIVTFFGAVFSLGYQTCLVRIFSFHVQNEILLQSIALGWFLCSVGIGTLFNGYFPSRKPLQRLAFVELVLSILGLSCFVLIHGISFILQVQPMFGEMGQTSKSLLVCLLLVGPLGFFTGFELPLCNQWSSESKRTIPYTRLLGLTYLGAVVGSFTTMLFLIPRIGTELTLLLLGGGNAVLAVVVALVSQTSKRFKFAFLLGLAFCSLLVSARTASERIVQVSLKSLYFELGSFRWSQHSWQSLKGFMNSIPDIVRWESEIQMIHILPPGSISWLNNPRAWALYLNGHLQFSTETVRAYHETMVWGGVSLLGRLPKKALILGGGDGLLARELLRIEGLRIDLVEIDQKIIELANTDVNFLAINQGSLMNERVRIHVEDAFRFVFESSERYDLILIDFPFPSTYELLRLFSKEFYQGARNRLAEDGLLVLDAPVWSAPLPSPDLIPPQWPLLNTVRAAGFQTTMVMGPLEPFLVAKEKQVVLEFKEELFPKDLSRKTHVNLLLLPAADVPKNVDFSDYNSLLFPRRIRW